MKLFRRDAGPETRATLESEVRRLGALIGAEEPDLVSFERRDGGHPTVEVDDEGFYHYVVIERGEELQHRRTGDRDEILYWALESTTQTMAGRWAQHHPADGQEHRVTRWIKQFELLHALNPAWAQRRRAELIEFLSPTNLPEEGVPPLPLP
ncbi:Imm63 family immunity protein [Actinoplanes sp. DH11]|uniref:Imm63 family immunity protein n=1 Tax=Actinoplanes sp. DH11 TaxID=2857011 RepID=UPI001E50366B|nr:Imm63 family immunity protein [Actinoplanes sp. DH11]